MAHLTREDTMRQSRRWARVRGGATAFASTPCLARGLALRSSAMTTLLAALLLVGPSGVAPPGPALVCVAPDGVDPPAYYAVDLVTTRNIPGTGHAEGIAHVTFAASPFGVALAPDGSYLYDVDLRLSDMTAPASGVLVGWVTTTQVDRIQRLGALDEHLSIQGQVGWNKFLVVVTLEERDDPSATTWSGPIALRGMSRSGMMHTMAGHGPFQQELCAKYGYR